MAFIAVKRVPYFQNSSPARWKEQIAERPIPDVPGSF